VTAPTLTSPGPPGATTEMACWPPLRTATTSDGWRVGLSRGVTRRANSAVALQAPADVMRAVDEVEALFAGEGLPAVMRTGMSALDRVVDAELDRRGWTTRAVTDVLARGQDRDGRDADAGARSALAVTVAREPDEDWLDAYLAVKSAGRHREVLSAILAGGDAWHLTARQGEEVVGVIRVARADGWAALSCLAVAPGARRRGIGRALTADGVRLAREHGVTRTFLQVERSNAGARALYDALGFVPVDSYRYREQPSTTA